MKLTLAAVEEAVDFRAEAEDIKDAAEEADLADVAEVDIFVATKEEEIIGTVDNMLKWCDTMIDKNWRFIHYMNSLTMNGTG